MTGRFRVLGLAWLLVASVALLHLAATTGSSSETEQTWTIMVYMAADVEESLPWLDDINEMEAAVGHDAVEVLVLVDPPGTGDTQLLRVEHDPDFFDPGIVSTRLDDGGAVIPGGGEVNTGSPATLSNFIVFGATEFPADRLVLVLWGHGAGWRGVCPDGYDLLTLPELGSALGTAERVLSRGLDMVVLDICDGSNLELAYEVCGRADLLLASEQVVPADGMPYMDVMNALYGDTSQTVEEFGIAIVDIYSDWAEYSSPYPTSMSLVDLGAVETFVEDFDELSRLGRQFDRLYHERLVDVFDSSYGEDDWTPDVGTFLDGMVRGDLPLEMRIAAMAAVEGYARAVVHLADAGQADSDGDGVPEYVTGMVVYAPLDGGIDSSYADLAIATTSWDEFALSSRLEREESAPGPGPDVTVEDSPNDANDLPDRISVEWSPEEGWNYTGYTVYAYGMLPHGLVPVAEVHAVTPIVKVPDAYGTVLLSASALVDGEAYSHGTVEVTVPAEVALDILLTGEGVDEGRTYEVSLSSSGGEEKVVAFADGECTVRLQVPGWADVGEVVRISVVDAGSGRVVAEMFLRMPPSGDASVTIHVCEPAMAEGNTVLLLGLIAAFSMLGIAAAVYWNVLRR